MASDSYTAEQYQALENRMHAESAILLEVIQLEVRRRQEAERKCGPNDAQDAARYRWLRSPTCELEKILPMSDKFFIAVEAIPSGNALDKLIDEQLRRDATHDEGSK